MLSLNGDCGGVVMVSVHLWAMVVVVVSVVRTVMSVPEMLLIVER